MEIIRDIYASLLRWKNNATRKPLILLGARQVGKTYILKKFGSQEYQRMVYVNCHHNPFAETLFQQDFDVKRILSSLSLYYNTPVTPHNTLIVFDEIQEVPQGIAALKYFCEDAREYHIAVAGSLLGITLRRGESYPVGKVNTLQMYPMTFLEFVRAGNPMLHDAILQMQWDVLAPLCNQITELLRRYYFTGGMPEVVATYLDSMDVKGARSIQREILRAYVSDMAKHTTTETQRIHMIWQSIPAQLAREKKKFKYADVSQGARAREYEMALQWLIDAGLIYKVERAKVPTRPLNFYADGSAFKVYLNDCGLLAAMAKTLPRDILIGNKVFEEFKGAFTENYVLQQIRPIDEAETFYYSKDNSTMEIDFLVQTHSRIIPMEVKAEENVKAKSLSTFITREFAQHGLKGLRCSMKSYIDQGWMENIPLYAVEAYIRNHAE